MPQARITDSYAVDFPLTRNMIQSTSSTTNREAKNPLALLWFCFGQMGLREDFLSRRRF